MLAAITQLSVNWFTLDQWHINGGTHAKAAEPDELGGVMPARQC